MFIHLADTSSDRGQYALLAECGHRSTLMSYAYANATKNFFPIAWRGVNVYLAGKMTYTEQHGDIFADVPKRLDSFAYPGMAEGYQQNKGPHARVLIDSGAFTAFMLGKTYTVQEYAKWALDFRSRWSDELAFLRFMNLDVIGDQDQTWENHRQLMTLGLDPIPVVTFGAKQKDLERAMEFGYFALGGLVPYAKRKVELTAWLDQAFSVLVKEFKRTGTMPKVHLLGVGQKWVVERYPAYSCDTSSWVAVLRFGGGRAAGIAKVPKMGDSSAANVMVLKAEIQKYQHLEDYVTRLWKERGVTWQE